MKVQLKMMAALLMAAVLTLGAGCQKDPENGGNNNGNENGGGSGGGNSGGGTAEGMYVGIIGFNDALTTKPIGILDNSTEQDFVSFINELSMRDATALYHADNTALDWLQNSTLPADLINVSLVTFTDGLDNASLMLNSNYNSQSEFLNAVNNRIMNDRVQDQSINAYAIGMKGNDVVDEASFRQNLQKLSSSPSNVFEVEDMNEATQRFREIASQLYNTTTTVSTNVKIPGGYDNNTVIRITFDNVTNGNNSTQYIQATYSREGGKGKLSNVNYYGLQSSSGATVISDRQDGLCYWYTFAELMTPNGDPVTNLDYMKLWRYISLTAEWQPESEFVPSSYSDVTVDRKSAVAILVLDCTTSLGSQDFTKMKEAAKEFIRVLNSNDGNGGGGNGGESNQYYDISVSATPSDGGTVIGGGTYQEGQTCTVTATANNDYVFNNWTENGSQVSNNVNYSFEVTGGRTLVAHFSESGAGNSMPTVTTSTPISITQNSATCGGEVTDDGGTAVTSRGVCWSTGQSPTLGSLYTVNGTGVGSFTSTITGLTQGTTYYVRAYATNSAGTAYGPQKSFTTSTPQIPTGAINGVFSVGVTDKVYFSQGNLQYQASTNTWQFASKQYTIIGTANKNISQTYTGWIDLFGWGTSGWNCGNTYYRPWNSYDNNGAGAGELYGPRGNQDLTGSYFNSDWGHYNAISNGGNVTGQWRTLTKDEWTYVFNTRSTASGIRYAMAKVAGHNGVILLPDNWNAYTYSLYNTNNISGIFNDNVISASQWQTLEDAGAVFLPVTGNRQGTTIEEVTTSGYYQSSSHGSLSYRMYCVRVDNGWLDPAYTSMNRDCGLAVRLVCPAN